jgi:type II secretory pathway component PulF
MLFKYKAIENSGKETEGTVDAVNVDVAISSLQRRGLVVSAINSAEKTSFLQSRIALFDHIPMKDVVIFSRQIATLFEAQVSALRAFRLLALESPNQNLRKRLAEVGDDLQAGVPISKALEKHPDVFSNFYVSMVRSGEEAGKLSESFLYLADYLDRTFEVTSKVKNALIYPAFVVITFTAVMILMLTVVIPKISQIILESGQTPPIYTQIVLSISAFFVNYGAFILIALIFGAFLLFRYAQTPAGKESLSQFKLSLPFIGTLYKKLYLSRIADNFSTMLASRIPILRAIEITASIVDNRIYEEVLQVAALKVKAGAPLSEALSGNDEIPGIMIAMFKVGEESGELVKILETMSRFYSREVTSSIDTIVSLIEPALIVFLGVGVGVLLAAVLIPIYNISSSF